MSHARPPEKGEESDSGGGISVEIAKPRVAAPRKYAVVLHNDDYTTMEFVIAVLQNIFGRTSEEAAAIMLSVHHRGRGVAGIYSYEIAETKAQQATELARAKEYPFQCTVEPAEGEGEKL